MKRGFCLPIAAAFAGSFCDLRADVIAGPYANPANGHSYYLLSLSTWSQAEAQAVELGGHLATVNDGAECKWIYEKFCFMGGSPTPLWIGLNDLEEEGVFKWVSGESSAFTNWHQGEPNNDAGLGSPEHFAFIFPAPGADGGWRDATDQALSDFDENPARWNTGPDAAIGCFGLVEIARTVGAPFRALVRRSGSNIEVSWPSQIGRTYQVQIKESLSGGTWKNSAPPLSGTGGDLLFKCPAAPGLQIFRVAEIP